MIYAFLVFWFGYWSAESGASLPWSESWQNKFPFAKRLPELIIAVSIGFIAVFFWSSFFDFSPFWIIGIWAASIAIAFAGKEAATWAYLDWESHTPKTPERKSTLRPLNDFIGRIFGYRLGNEGYSWIWAASKGFIMTLPLGGTGALFHPIGHEIGSHAKGRLLGDSNMWKEIAGGAIGIGIPACICILLGGING